MASCGACGRTLDDCGTCVCASRYSLAQERPLDHFVRYAVEILLRLPSLEVLPEGSTCNKCGANVSLADYCEECEANR